jgi:succinyl-CoA synthetase beta subunit
VAASRSWGLRDHQARNLADGIGIPKDLTKAFIKIAQALYKAFVGTDASLAEINPLVITATTS